MSAQDKDAGRRPARRPRYKVKGYALVNDESGRIMLDQHGFNVRSRASWGAVIWMDKQAAKLNCDATERVVRVEITEIE